ncbi:MAG: ABC transporter permease [Candidatus Nanohaloarchaea archaeon]
MLLDFLRLSVNSLRHRKKRSWLTVIGTMIGIMAVVSLVSIGEGLESSVASEINELGGDKVFVTESSNTASRFSRDSFRLTEEDLDAVRSARGVENAVGTVSASADSSYGDDEERLSIRGLPTGRNREIAKEIYGLEVEKGRYLAQSDTGSVLIEKGAAEDTYEEEVVLNSDLEINGTEYRVVGIFTGSQAVGNLDGVVMPVESAREVAGKDDSFDLIAAEIGESSAAGDVADRIASQLRDRRGTEKGGERFTVRTAQDVIRSFKDQIQIIRAVVLGIGAISLLVGSVGIMNTMYTAVAEREEDIGVMKAVGATRKQILAVFLIESGMIGASGGLIGAVTGVGVSYGAGFVIREQLPLPFQPLVSPELVAGATAFSFLVGSISGALPAVKAARKEPVEALRD